MKCRVMWHFTGASLSLPKYSLSSKSVYKHKGLSRQLQTKADMLKLSSWKIEIYKFVKAFYCIQFQFVFGYVCSNISAIMHSVLKHTL